MAACSAASKAEIEAVMNQPKSTFLQQLHNKINTAGKPSRLPAPSKKAMTDNIWHSVKVRGMWGLVVVAVHNRGAAGSRNE
jgi:hypothetical protein